MNLEVAQLKDIEDKIITITLSRTQGNRAESSRLLGMSERTLQHKIAQRMQDKIHVQSNVILR